MKWIVCGAVGVLVSVGGWALAWHGQHETEVSVKVLSAVDIEEVVDGEKCKSTTLEVTFAPGAESKPHRHPGAIFGYVIEGEFEFAVDDGEVQKLKAGETFYEPAMALHSVARNPSEKTRTRVLAVMVHPRSAKELTIPVPANGK